eukprot:scaffold147525_cov18-Tisochrysis_lutea.AAC.1
MGKGRAGGEARTKELLFSSQNCSSLCVLLTRIQMLHHCCVAAHRQMSLRCRCVLCAHMPSDA